MRRGAEVARFAVRKKVPLTYWHSAIDSATNRQYMVTQVNANAMAQNGQNDLLRAGEHQVISGSTCNSTRRAR
jgi:hypothetical protein